MRLACKRVGVRHLLVTGIVQPRFREAATQLLRGSERSSGTCMLDRVEIGRQAKIHECLVREVEARQCRQAADRQRRRVVHARRRQLRMHVSDVDEVAHAAHAELPLVFGHLQRVADAGGVARQ